MSAALIIGVTLTLALLAAGGLTLRRIMIDERVARRRTGIGAAALGEAKRRPSLLAPLIFGFGAALAFLAAYVLAPVPVEDRFFVGTCVFIIASVALTLAYRVPRRQWRPLPWSALLIVVMGGLTLSLHEEIFIKTRPTLLFAAAHCSRSSPTRPGTRDWKRSIRKTGSGSTMLAGAGFC